MLLVLKKENIYLYMIKLYMYNYTKLVSFCFISLPFPLYFTISRCYRLSIVMRCANNDDSVTLKAQDGSDTINFVFENPSEPSLSIIT